MGPLAALDPQELLAHSEWLRGFARALVRNEAEGDDLAQEAMGVLAATNQKVRDLRGYLKGTVRHLASKERRQAVRRRDREESLVREQPQVIPSTSLVTERMDLMRVVLEEVGHLPEGQARIIGLRYLEGLAVSEIAERDGIQPSSVRATLARGLERLRARLDGRFDGRDAWSAVLAPWALPFPVGVDSASTAHGGSTQGPLQGAASKGASVSTPASLLASTLGLVMSFKPTFIVAASLIAAFGAWRALSGPGAGLVPVAGPALTVPADSEVARLDGDSTGVTPAPSTEGVRAPKDPPVAPLELPAKHAGSAALEGIFVDASTAEPIPGLSVRFGYLKGGEPAQTDFISSDASGRFDLGDQRLPREGLSISVVDPWANASLLMTEDFEMPGDRRVPVEIGPTFTLLPMGVTGNDLLARRFRTLATGPGIRMNSPEETSYNPAKCDWIRFGRPFASADDEGPWPIVLESTDGLMVGTGELPRRLGIEPAPVTVVMEPRGAVLFTLDPAGAAHPDYCTVEVESELLAQPVSVNLRSQSGAMMGQLKFLEPGLYRWSITRGTTKESGEVQVVALVQESVLVRLPGASAWEPRVIVDASAAPEVDVTEWPGQFLRLDGSNQHFECKMERVGGASAGQFEAHMDSLPAGDWSYAVLAPPGYVADPMIATVERGGEAPVIRIFIAESADVQLAFVDSETGKPLRPTTVSHFDGIKSERVEVSKEGLGKCRPPAGHPTYFIAHLEGYKMVRVPFEPGVSSTEIRVALESGWRSRVIVLSAAVQGPVEGVGLILDGEPLGKTNAAGEIWIDGDSAPDLIELDSESKQRFKVLVSSFSKDNMSGSDGDPLGYLFLVAAK